MIKRLYSGPFDPKNCKYLIQVQGMLMQILSCYFGLLNQQIHRPQIFQQSVYLSDIIKLFTVNCAFVKRYLE